ELAEDLRRFGCGEPIQARPVGRGEQLVKWVRRRPARAMALGMLVLILLMGFVGGSVTVLWFRAEHARELAEQAQHQATTARDQMETALQGEQHAKEQEILARRSEAQAKEQLDQLSYIHRVNLAQHELDAGELTRARELLKS